MSEDQPATYATIAEAEKAITDAGYIRDAAQHIWVQRDSGKKCKVVRGGENNLRFFVQSA